MFAPRGLRGASWLRWVPNHFGSSFRVYISFQVHVVLSTFFRLADDLVASRFGSLLLLRAFFHSMSVESLLGSRLRSVLSSQGFQLEG